MMILFFPATYNEMVLSISEAQFLVCALVVYLSQT